MAAIIVSRRFQALLKACVSQASSVPTVNSIKPSFSWSVVSRIHVPKTISTTTVQNSQNTDENDLTDSLWPRHVIRLGEEVERKRARLFYQSRKRGMLENGLLLSTFASLHLANMTPAQLDQYDDIINRPSNDWKLYYWMTGREETPNDYDNEVMDMLKEHARNENREMRCRQPDLTERDCSMTNKL